MTGQDFRVIAECMLTHKRYTKIISAECEAEALRKASAELWAHNFYVVDIRKAQP